MATRARTVLALDTGSPSVSVAVATDEGILSEIASRDAVSSQRLLSLVDEALTTARCRLSDLSAVCALQGPGSFTGLRVGLATVLGFHQALGIRATAVPTLEALAFSAESSPVMALVDALRGLWFHQSFRLDADNEPEALSASLCEPTAGIAFEGVATVTGFGLSSLRPLTPGGVSVVEPRCLAGRAAQLAARRDRWDSTLLVQPLYLRPTPVRPKPAFLDLPLGRC